jgi:tetratricopeptide (TPR) repeat protein
MKADLPDNFQSDKSKGHIHVDIKKSKPEKLLSNPYWYEGKLFLQRGRFKDALAYFDMSIRIDEQFTPAYVGKGEALLALDRTHEATQVFDHVLSLQPEYAQAIIGKGKSLLKLQKYSEAIEKYELALEIINRFVCANLGNGQAIFASKYYRETLYAYKEAINHDVRNEQLYRKVAALLQSIYDNPYEDAPPQLDFFSPYLYMKLGDVCFTLEYYIPAYNAYQQALTKGIGTFSVYMRIGDCLAINNCIREAILYYNLAIENFARTNHATLFPFSENTLCISRLSANKLFDVLCTLLSNLSLPEFAKGIFHTISQLYDQCLNHLLVPPETYEQCIVMLEKTLCNLSTEQYNEALLILSQQDAIRLSYLLIALVPDEPKYLENQLSKLVLHEAHVIKDALLAAHLHKILPKYHVPQEENDLFYAHSLITQHRYTEAQQLLTQLVHKPDLTLDLLWSVFLAMQQCGSAPLQQIAVLRRFIELAPTDERIKEAWLYLGDLYSTGEGTGREAIQAYQAGEDLGATVPHLHAFRMGNWDAIPALRSDPDYPFPTVVVLDLECAYKPDAQPGSTIYEIAAVRCKGKTELTCYQTCVQPSDPGIKLPQRCTKVQELSHVVAQLQEFIGDAIVVGHNIQEFDAKELRGIQVTIDDNQIIDTLLFARLLYPDSIHHHLGLLCEKLSCTFEGQRHEALPDAHACAALFQALSDELMRRGDDLITGFRAFISPDSAFDRAVLQPRRIPADPSLQWELHSVPHAPHPLIVATDSQVMASPHMIEFLNTQQDALVELYDPHAKYISAISSRQRAFVIFGTRHRLERALLAAQNRSDIFVLPDPRTLLCSERVRQRIEAQSDIVMKLTLFCLYQASHNHDARTLYPWRIPGYEALRDMLLADCCGHDADHTMFCPAFTTVEETVTTASLLLSTHDVFIQHQRLHAQQADLIIVDDADELQMRFAQTLAETVDSAYLPIPTLNMEEQHEIQYLTEEISRLAHEYIDSPGAHERLHLHIIASEQNTALHDRLSCLENTGPTGRQIVQQIRTFLQNAKSYHQLPQIDERVRAYWLDLWFAASDSEDQKVLQEPKMEIGVVRWRFCALDSHLQDAFKMLFLQGFKHRIVCGSAITLGSFKDTFVRRFFGLANNFTFAQDSRPPTQLVIPATNSICPSSFLNRGRWAREVGQFLFHWMHTKQQSLVVTLHELSVANALTEAFANHREKLAYNLLSPHLNWPTSKIAERLADPDYRSLTLLTPTLRRKVLDGPVEIEATGPLRFLNQRDPLERCTESLSYKLFLCGGRL